MTDTLTLFVDSLWISPYALSAFVALEEKRLPYTVVDVSLPKKEHFQAGYQARTHRVPSLKHGDYVLSESSAIAEYLAETFPFPHHPRRFPQDRKERGICRGLQAWGRSDLMPIREERPTHTLFYERAKAPMSEKCEAAVTRLLAAVTPLIRADRTTLFAEWCIADTDLAVMLQRLNLNGHPLPAAVQTYAEANWARPSVQKWVTHARPPYTPY